MNLFGAIKIKNEVFALSNRKIKMIVNILMLIAVILSFRRFDGNPTVHVIAGIVCCVLFVIHYYLNRKTFTAFRKGIRKLKTMVKLKYLIDWLLIIVWSIAIILGFIALFSYLEIVESTSNFGRLHGVFARVGGVLILIHVFQHGKTILSYFKKKKGNRNEV
jgi:hypothetical protein